jgi:RNA polymerase sigma-70 factor (ECF subfamily)
VADEIALLSAAEDHPAEQTAWREEIDRALQLLRPDQREAFVLKYVEELGYDEMSQVTGVGVSALKMRVMRACERLRELLSEVHSV